jgi:rod shape-determining protein MreC
MESLLHRYRNITVLFVAILAQIGAVAYQVRRDNDVPLLRVWAVSAVTPVAAIIENLRAGASGVFGDFISFSGTRDQGRALRAERDRLRLENQLLKNELSAAQRAASLAGFLANTPSKLLGASVIGVTTGMGTRSVLIDRGSNSGVVRGMAVVTPDGIVGRVLAAYPLVSQVLSVTDAGFAASVETQKNHTRGVLKGMGSSSAKIDYVPSGQKVEKGEIFFTSGDDRVFPRGMPAGRITSVEDGAQFQEIYAEPFGAEAAPEQVFVIIDPIHGKIPDVPVTDSPVFLGPDSPAASSGDVPPTSSTGTQADKVVDQYKKIGAAQNHVFGEGPPGSIPPNFNIKVPGVNAPGIAVGASGAMGLRVAPRPSASTGNLPRASSGSSAGAGMARAGASGPSGLRGNVPRIASGRTAGAGVSSLAARAGVAGPFSSTGNIPRAASGRPTGIAVGGSGLVRRIPRPAGASGSTIGARAASGGGSRP